jgi:hypothetical protein
MRAVEEYVDTAATVDTETIQARVKNVQSRVEKVSEIKKKCSSTSTPPRRLNPNWTRCETTSPTT